MVPIAALLLLAVVCRAGVEAQEPEDIGAQRSTPPSFGFSAYSPFGDFRHEKGGSGRRYLVETMGSGLGLVDVDGDGDLDVYFVQGAPLPGAPPGRPVNRLFLNDGKGSFSEPAEPCGLEDAGYGMGCAAGDIDNDGDADLYLTNFGTNRLFRNDGHGRFEDITESAGVGDAAWGSSAAFADFDGDGRLDLYVANYLDFSIETHKECTLGKGIPAYCSPDAYPGVADRLYRNRGDGTFEDMTARAGLDAFAGKSLGVICGDFGGDGRIDIYVANDGVANQLLLNRGEWRFEDVTLLCGVGYSGDGMAQAGMGIAAGDLDGDGRTEIFVTNLSAETNVLYRGEAGGFFSDGTVAMKLGAPSLLYTGFGTAFGDFDADGDLDIFVANGHVIDNIRELNDYMTYEQPDHFYRNDGKGFVEVTRAALRSPPPPGAGRGAALGDVDGDGDLDLVVTNCEGIPVLYRNDTPSPGHWLQIRLIGTRSNRDGIGARLELEAGDRRLLREVHGGGSYLSQHDLRVHFGLGAAESVQRLVVRWPSGVVQELKGMAVDRRIDLQEPSTEERKP